MSKQNKKKIIQVEFIFVMVYGTHLNQVVGAISKMNSCTFSEKIQLSSCLSYSGECSNWSIFF